MELEKLLSEVSDIHPKYSKNSSSFCTKPKYDNSKMIHKLKNDMYKMLDLIHNLDEEVKEAKKMCYSMKETCDTPSKPYNKHYDIDDKITDFIQCQINQKMDSILDTMNTKFEDIEKRISKIYKGFTAVSCRK
ncbi:MAG: hypothetical protein CMF62_02855 [Magnetococcales bacterium]|nr:hypothetical protein [Magnetococcales bacterium]